MAEKVAKAGVKKESGYLYFIDKDGDVSRAKMARGGAKGQKGATEKPACSSRCQQFLVPDLVFLTNT